MESWEMLEPKTRKFIQSLEAQGGPPLYQLGVEEARGILDRLQSATQVTKLPADIRDEVFPVGPSGQVSVRIIRPQGRTEALPVILYCHGGGWILGNQETHDRLVREIAFGSDAAVVFVNYTPAPEAHFPTQIEEAFSALKYIFDRGSEFGLDPSRIAVVGDSVGGNMATVLALVAKERGGPPLLMQCLFYPVTDSNFDSPSYRKFASGPWLTREAMKWFWKAYLPDEKARRNPLASPLQAPLEQLRGLPRALVFTDENDVLRHEGEAYAHKLMKAEVEVSAIRFVGTIHDFMLLNAIADTPDVRTAIHTACLTLKNAFARERRVGARAA